MGFQLLGISEARWKSAIRKLRCRRTEHQPQRKTASKRFHRSVSAGESVCPEDIYRKEFYLHGSTAADGKPQLPSAELGAGAGSQHFPHASLPNKYAATPFLGNELDTHRKTKEGS